MSKSYAMVGCRRKTDSNDTAFFKANLFPYLDRYQIIEHRLRKKKTKY